MMQPQSSGQLTLGGFSGVAKPPWALLPVSSLIMVLGKDIQVITIHPVFTHAETAF
jgi:hypothetical protein